MTHALSGNWHGLIVDVETTLATGTAEWEAARHMIGRTVRAGATVGADKGYDTADFVASLQAQGIKMVGGLRKTRHKGIAELAGQALLCFAAYNLACLQLLAPRMKMLPV